MARKPSARVVYNRATANAVMLGLADGVLAVGQAIIERANPPDAPPIGKGLVKRGGAVAYLNGAKVGGNTNRPSGQKPLHFGVEGYAGFGFPARFQEMGTVHQQARPFLTPAINAILPGAENYIRPKAAARVRGR